MACLRYLVPSTSHTCRSAMYVPPWAIAHRGRLLLVHGRGVTRSDRAVVGAAADLHMFAALSRAFPLHPASGIISATASAIPTHSSFYSSCFPPLFPTASLKNGPPDGTIPASVGSQPKGQWASHPRGGRQRVLCRLRQRGLRRDGPCSATWRSRPAGAVPAGDGSNRSGRTTF